jgi:hypothetical protein
MEIRRFKSESLEVLAQLKIEIEELEGINEEIRYSERKKKKCTIRLFFFKLISYIEELKNK